MKQWHHMGGYNPTNSQLGIVPLSRPVQVASHNRMVPILSHPPQASYSADSCQWSFNTQGGLSGALALPGCVALGRIVQNQQSGVHQSGTPDALVNIGGQNYWVTLTKA